MKHRVIGALACLAVMCGTPASAQGSLWGVQTSDDGTVVASIVTDHPTATGTMVVSMLNIGFGPTRGCQPEIGIALLKGSGYGNPIGKMPPAQTEPVNLVVDQRLVSTPAPFLVKYDNGLEAIFPADAQILQSLAIGTTATVQIVSGTPRFDFPITGAGDAIANARRECLSSR